MSIDTFFTAIKDGTWHNINELSNQLATSTTKLSELSNFLANYGLIKYEEETRRIMIQPIGTFLLSTEEEPKIPKNILANFIIPPQ